MASYWVVVVAFGVWAKALVIRVRVWVGQKMDMYTKMGNLIVERIVSCT